MLLKGKTAIITGAGGGIGSVIAKTFAKEGCSIVLIDRAQSNVDSVFDELKKYHCESLSLIADVYNKEDVENTIKSALAKFSKIDILVNAAGILGPIGPFSGNDIDKWLLTINVNLSGTVFFVKSVLPIMMKQGFGKIINFSGGGAFNPRPNFSAYAVSKAAVVRLTETLAQELKEYNIQVNAISPGAVNTNMLEEVLGAGPIVSGTDYYKKAEKQKAEGGDSPQLSADLILFLCSEKSYNLTGKTISARWDNWRAWNEKNISEIMASDLYTLKRIIQ